MYVFNFDLYLQSQNVSTAMASPWLQGRSPESRGHLPMDVKQVHALLMMSRRGALPVRGRGELFVWYPSAAAAERQDLPLA